MTKIEETENVFFALGTALKAEGFKAIRFYRIRTRRQLFSVVGREDLRREEADDTMYSIEASIRRKSMPDLYESPGRDRKCHLDAAKDRQSVWGGIRQGGLLHLAGVGAEDVLLG